VPAPQDLLDQIAAIAKRRVASRRRRARPAPRGIVDELNRAAIVSGKRPGLKPGAGRGAVGARAGGPAGNRSRPTAPSARLRAAKTPWVPIGVGAVVLVLVAGVAAIVISENAKTGTGSGRSYMQTPGTYKPIPMPPAPSPTKAATQEQTEQADSDAAALLKQARQLEARRAFLLSVIQAYEFVIQWHPDSPEAKEAREAINRLRGDTPKSEPATAPRPGKG
jgi:hypothetical protein